MLTGRYMRRLGSVVKWIIPMLLAFVLLFGSTGCVKPKPAETLAFEVVEGTTKAAEIAETLSPENVSSSEDTQPGQETSEEPETEQTEASEAEAETETEASETEAAETKTPETEAPETKAPETKAPETKAAAGASVTEDGEYTSKEEVAEYIHLYGHLPDNFITKKEAKALGWEGGDSLGRLAPGKSIGGDRFGNYEGQLPDKKGRKYTECDIDYKGKKRNAKRIIFSNDGLIFYTEDHYKTFEQLY